jgi:hypothetical protein
VSKLKACEANGDCKGPGLTWFNMTVKIVTQPCSFLGRSRKSVVSSGDGVKRKVNASPVAISAIGDRIEPVIGGFVKLLWESRRGRLVELSVGQ